MKTARELSCDISQSCHTKAAVRLDIDACEAMIAARDEENLREAADRCCVQCRDKKGCFLIDTRSCGIRAAILGTAE